MVQENVSADGFLEKQVHSCTNRDYEEAILTLNSLQSNASVIHSMKQQGNISNSRTRFEDAKKYLLRTDVTFELLDKLSVIHVSGTKGKGSTCAFCESILRHHGYRTGFFSSPHLVSVKERIRINGEPINKSLFTYYFWKVYDKLYEKQECDKDMPPYFKFLTILAFNIFLNENIDVAVIEVGLGGEYDCTNVLRKVPVIGITSLGLDHTSILGNTVEEIAWQKAGILKKNGQAFTVTQNESALQVLKNRSVEKDCTLRSVPDFSQYVWTEKPPKLGVDGDIQQINASLAIQLSHAWMYQQERKKYFIKTNKPYVSLLKIPNKTKLGLINCFWPGRSQILNKDNKRFYFDGAHTAESINICVDWFKKNVSNPSRQKVLLFNVTGDRDSEKLLSPLKDINFDYIVFLPNVAFKEITSDLINYNNPKDHQLLRCKHHEEIWKKINKNNKSQQVKLFPCVTDALEYLPPSMQYDILVTGSLHLVGAVLSIIDPDLTNINKTE